MPDTEVLLQPVNDGLTIRPSGIWAKKKLRVLAHYIATSTVAMKNKPWRRRFYIDLQAGPGKNCVADDNDQCPSTNPDVFLGSPLLALTEGAKYSSYFFVEQDEESASALRTRCKSLSNTNPISIIEDDCNNAVDQICDAINRVDTPPFSKTDWNSLSLAFLDPEGLELNWETVVKLASLKRTDIVINFSIGGLRRRAGHDKQMPPGTTRSDQFFGTTEWRGIPDNPDSSKPAFQWIEFYQARLQELEYQWGTPVPVKNTTNVELYRLLFASKHQLGVELWEEARKNAPRQRALF